MADNVADTNKEPSGTLSIEEIERLAELGRKYCLEHPVEIVKDEEYFINSFEWRFDSNFNNFPTLFDEFPLLSVSMDNFAGWLESWKVDADLGAYKWVEVFPTTNEFERRFEFRNRFSERVDFRVKIKQLGNNLRVFVRSGYYVFSSNSGNIVVVYYLLYEMFYLALIDHWRLHYLGYSKRYLGEKSDSRYKDALENGKMISYEQLTSLDYSVLDKGKNKNKSKIPDNTSEPGRPGPDPLSKEEHQRRVSTFFRIKKDFPRGNIRLWKKKTEEELGLTWRQITRSFHFLGQSWT